MVLSGCAQGQNCAPIATLPVAYRSEASCLAARGDIVAASAELGFDRVIAECRPHAPTASRKGEAGPAPTA
jgi:hypothetical protein